MNDIVTVLMVFNLSISVVIVVSLFRKKSDNKDEAVQFKVLQNTLERLERAVQEEMLQNRKEMAAATQGLREEVSLHLGKMNESVLARMHESQMAQLKQLEAFSSQLQNTARSIDERLVVLQESNAEKLEAMRKTVEEKLAALATQIRESISKSLNEFNDSVLKRMHESQIEQTKKLELFSNQLQGTAKTINEKVVSLQEASTSKMEAFRTTVDEKLGQLGVQLRDGLSKSLKDFNDSMTKQLSEMGSLQSQQNENMRKAVEQRLQRIQEDNGKKLEEMRRTVDEKLHETLEKRLGDSFKLVSDRLEQVHKGLGEMQNLAAGVGDLKKVMTNVKTRGIWGEIQLGNLLEQILTPDQYEQNVATKAGSNERVEYAIKLPGRDKDKSTVWLPIDAKFPQEDYQRLLEAQEQANPSVVEEAAKALELRVKGEAKNIAEKYLDVPHTTDFGILFLPTEGLYAEVLRRTGLCEGLMQKERIIIAGPTTLGALLNSLQMGFRTLAIERRSSEVWALLGAVKTEFGKFGDLLDKTGKKLQEAGNTINNASVRSRAIERKLRQVQELPAAEAAQLLELAENQ